MKTEQRREGQEPNCRNCGYEYIENPKESVRCYIKGGTRFMGRICGEYTPRAGHSVRGCIAVGQSI